MPPVMPSSQTFTQSRLRRRATPPVVHVRPRQITARGVIRLAGARCTRILLAHGQSGVSSSETGVLCGCARCPCRGEAECSLHDAGKNRFQLVFDSLCRALANMSILELHIRPSVGMPGLLRMVVLRDNATMASTIAAEQWSWPWSRWRHPFSTS